MAAHDAQKIIVEELPGGGKRWRLANPRPDPKQETGTFPHKVGSGHNLIRLFELFIVAWDRCEELEDHSLLIPDPESASELYGLSLELHHRIGRELMRVPNTRGGGIYYDDHPGGVRHILHACLVMSGALQSMKINEGPFTKGVVLPVAAWKEFHRAVRILTLWFNDFEDVEPTALAPGLNPLPLREQVDALGPTVAKTEVASEPTKDKGSSSWERVPPHGAPLRGWAAICGELGTRNTRGRRRSLRAENGRTEGPIVYVARRPEADRGRLQAWMQGIEERARIAAARSASNTGATDELAERGGIRLQDYKMHSEKRPNSRGKARPAPDA